MVSFHSRKSNKGVTLLGHLFEWQSIGNPRTIYFLVQSSISSKENQENIRGTSKYWGIKVVKLKMINRSKNILY